MEEIQANFEKLEDELLQANASLATLKTNHVQLMEMKAVLDKVSLLLDAVNIYFHAFCLFFNILLSPLNLLRYSYLMMM